MALSVVFDYAQRRMQWDRLSVVASGMDWNGPYWSDTWIDPITETLMLRPSPLYASFETSNSGLYAKTAIGSTTQNDSSKWTSGVTRGVIEYWKTETANEWIRLSSALGRNRPVWLSIFNHSDGGAVTAQCYAGWSDSSDYTDASGVGLVIYTDGTVDVYRHGSFAGSGKVSKNADNQYLDLLLIPMRRRELLVISSKTLDGFSVVFDDIAEDETEPFITPAKKFFAKNPSGALQVHFSPVKFQTTGYAETLVLSFAEAPTVSDTYETWDLATWLGGSGRSYKLFGDHAFEGSSGSTTCTGAAVLRTETDGAWSADGVTKKCRIKATLGGPGTHTPFIYGGMVAYNAIFDDTDDSEEYDATADLQSCRLSVPDSGTDTSVDLEILRLDDFESNVAAARTQCNRPINVKLGTCQLLAGRNDAPEWTDDWNAENKHLHLHVRDFWKAIDGYRFQDILPLDGMLVSAALQFLLEKIVGIPSANLDIETASYTLPSVPKEKSGWNVLIQQGDTLGDWVRRLVEDYAATWMISVMPSGSGLKLTIRSESTLSVSPDVTLYESESDALLDGVDPEDVEGLLFWNYHEQVVEPEGNDVWATGQDPRDRRAIQSHKVDDAARDLSTAPSSRPENWTGEYRRVGLIAPELTTQDDTDFAAETIYDRVSPLVKIADFGCNLPVLAGSDVPLWRGHMVRLYGKGTYRILSLECDFRLETTVDSADYVHREARYVAKFLAEEPS